MNERLKRLTEEIRKLPPEEQAELIDELIVLTYREPNPEIDKAWAEEAERRMARHDSGVEPGVDAFAAVEELRAKFAKRRGE
jgi:hypothetical protein